MSPIMKRTYPYPLITPEMVKPSHPDFQVDCVINAGVTECDGKIILLLRVAESVRNPKENAISIPILEVENGKSNIGVLHLDRKQDSDKYDFSDPRSISCQQTGQIVYLTSLSHLRVAHSHNGVEFCIEEVPSILPEGVYETFGMEDPRITKIEDTYYINYTAVSAFGAATALITTRDFRTFVRKGVIFPPENKDVCIFPEKINGYYYAYHRPVPKAIGNPDIWLARSPDLLHWGDHQHVIGVSSSDCWENGRIGGGAPSFRTDQGWVHIYHAADRENRYCLGAFLADLDDPANILAKTEQPLLTPEMSYEREGFFPNVVFTCGLTVDQAQDQVTVYYGGADTVMARAEITITEIFQAMNQTQV